MDDLIKQILRYIVLDKPKKQPILGELAKRAFSEKKASYL